MKQKFFFLIGRFEKFKKFFNSKIFEKNPKDLKTTIRSLDKD